MQLRQLTISADSGGVNLPSCVGVGFIWGDTRCNRHRIRHKPASKQQGNSDNNILAVYTIVNASTSVQHVLATLPPHRSYSLHSLLLHQPLNVLCDAPSWWVTYKLTGPHPCLQMASQVEPTSLLQFDGK
jgi:hypothetical protein